MTAVRRAGPADAPAVGRLLFDFNTEFETETPPAEELAGRFAALMPHDHTLVLLTGEPGRETGFAYLSLRPTPYYDAPIALLEELYVVPSLRGRGIGTALLTTAIDVVRERGVEEMQIGVDEDDEDTRRFYERHGFSHRQPGSEWRMFFYERQL